MSFGQDETMQGFGCAGCSQLGADGHLYDWVQGVDGLGNPVGFWRRRLRQGWRRFRRAAPGLVRQYAAPYVQRVMPYVQQAIPVPVPVAPDAVSVAPPPPPVPPVAPPVAPAPPTPEQAVAGWGLAADDSLLGIGAYGEIVEGIDGQLYQWVQGIDGLGNPVGFWKKLKALKRRVRGLVRRAMPIAQRFAPFIPGGSAALTAATPFLRQAGVAGYGDVGAIYNEELNGLSDDELHGLAEDDELRGYGEDELHGFADDDLQGPYDEGVNGFADDELSGFSDDELQGFADDDIQGMNGYIRQDGVQGLGAFLPAAPPETPWFKAPAQPPSMWSPLW